MKSDFVKLIDELEDIKKRYTLEHSKLMVYYKPYEQRWEFTLAGFLDTPDIKFLKKDGLTLKAVGGNIVIHQLVLCSLSEKMNKELTEISREAALLLPALEYEKFGVTLDILPECRWLMCLYCFMDMNKPRWIENGTVDRGETDPNSFDLIKPCEASIEYLKYLLKPARKNKANSKEIMAAREEKAWDIYNNKTGTDIYAWAEILGCSVATVSGLLAWKEFQSQKKKNAPGKKLKGVNFSDGMQQVVGQEDPSLKAIMEDQKRDFESSPLDPNGQSPIHRRDM